MKTCDNIRMYRLYSIVLGAILALQPGTASADIGIPMIAPALPLMFVCLIPVILIEAIVLVRRLGVAFPLAFRSVSVANLVSMLVGVPLTWIFLVILAMGTGADGSPNLEVSIWLENLLSVTWSAPWLGGLGETQNWMIPVAMLVLLVPFFFASWLIEKTIIARMVDFDRRKVSRACLIGNAITYTLMAAFVIFLWLLYYYTEQVDTLQNALFYQFPLAASVVVTLILPLLLACLLPAILIETVVLAQSLRISRGVAVLAATVASAVSMLIGIPAALLPIIILVIVLSTVPLPLFSVNDLAYLAGFETVEKSWRIEYMSGEGAVGWFFLFILLIPLAIASFHVSWFIDTRIVARLTKRDRTEVRVVCRKSKSLSLAPVAAAMIFFIWRLLTI